MTIIKELQAVKELLALEKQEDFDQFRALMQSLSQEEKITKGLAWYPLEVGKTGYTIGDRAFVIVERTKHLEQHHQFRAGGTVNLFSNVVNAYQPEQSGVINYINKNRMKIVLNSKDLPEWINNGSIGVEVLFDERTYLEMEKAINEVIKAKGNRLAELRDIILGKDSPTFLPNKQPIHLPSLNTSQNIALNHIITAEDVAIVHGPPGTGKTTTIVKAIKQICATEKTILVCAPSNAAVDLLTERLWQEGVNTVRVGNISRVDESLINLTLEGRMASHPDTKNIKKVRKQAAELRRKGKRWKRSFNASDRAERKAIFAEARELENWASHLEERIVDEILFNAEVITATLVGSKGRYIDKIKFRTLIIDEAAQALEPATWIPILSAKRVIFAGDPLQLPPTVKSFDAARKGFNITLMEKSMERIEATFLLNTQYRMHRDIMGFSNRQFYNNELLADDSVNNWSLGIDDYVNQAVEYIDTAGCGFDEKVNEESLSSYNPEEFLVLREHLILLLPHFDNDNFPTIGIISPYREQVLYMRTAIEEDSELADFDLDVNTIDAFQGQERDIIYISLVRSNPKGIIGFLSDYRRMNVAMTRAKKKLVVIGDSATLGSHDFYQNFITYCEEIDAYRTAWEFMK